LWLTEKPHKKMSREILNFISMKRSKVLVVSIAFMTIFACVLSCNEQENLAPASNTQGTIGSPKFDGTEGDPLDLETAKRWTSNYRAINSTGVQAHYFGNEIIRQLLDRPGCVGIRMYYAIDDKGERKLLLIGVDAKGENLMPSANGRSTEEEDPIVDFSFPCPSTCPSNGL
jgi:hypothetical protein